MEGRRFAAPALLGLAITLVYANGLEGSFIFDDVPNIVQNPNIRSLSPSSWFPRHPRPFVQGTFAMNYALSGLAVRGYHLTNILVHVACAWVAFALLRRLLRSETAAFLAVLVWAVHPLHTTVVQYVVHRYESCAALGMLIALYGVERGIGAVRSKRWFALGIAGALFAYGSKEIAIGLPILVLLYDRAFHAGSFREAFSRRGALHAAFFLSAGTLLLYVLGAPRNASQGAGFSELTPLDYARSQLGVIPYYGRLLVWPASLSFDYSDWPIARSLSEVALPAALVGTMLIAAAVAWVRSPRVGFGLVAIFVILAPTSSIFPLHGELVAERRMYLPSLVLCAVAAAAAVRWVRSLALGRWVLVGALGLAFGFGARTVVRNRDFSDEVTAYGSVLRERPSASRIRYMLARSLQVRGDLLRARDEYRRVLVDEPNMAWAHNNLGVLYVGLGDWTAAEAAFLQALRLLPGDIEARMSLVECRIRLGKLDAARKTLLRGLERAPNEPRLLAKLRKLDDLAAQASPPG